MMFYSVAKDGVFSTATSDLTIGCVRTMAVSQKKVRPHPICFWQIPVLGSCIILNSWIFIHGPVLLDCCNSVTVTEIECKLMCTLFYNYV